MSLSARRAWIEIAACGSAPSANGSLSARRAWIEIAPERAKNGITKSLSARRAWIEISLLVALLVSLAVALRKESVDRNRSIPKFLYLFKVALRKESVDRNKHKSPAGRRQRMSLSARRAWIEIVCSSSQ